MTEPRLTSQPAFWNERYRNAAYLFGETPSPFLVAQAATLAPDSDVLLLGAGEGRNAVWLAEQGHYVTAVDYAEDGLRKVGHLAHARGVDVRCIQADVGAWDTLERWDAVGVFFLHLLPDERRHLYRLIRHVLRPGGRLMAEWFRPEQVTDGYTSGGPSRLDRMVTANELRAAFPDGTFHRLDEAVIAADAGILQGDAAVVHVVWEAPSDESESKTG